tara:strand:+ start:2213 stop:2506 length:294 start_codon:yes stop_codon:yes gene_type:complete
MSERAYYKVALTRTTVNSRGTAARAIGISESALGHETPQWQVAPDGTYGLLRVHYERVKDGGDVTFTGKDAYEGIAHVTPISDLDAADLRASWNTEE